MSTQTIPSLDGVAGPHDDFEHPRQRTSDTDFYKRGRPR